ncbi:tripartite tricarboxylate transporter TctB family protein [Oribacterium sp. Sow4_G1_1]|uniref:tripartite tricarboxylate transporter TctB family protein n=1 Tax=Oribacterium sp. Sow4_G1_1 TaxID=3438794 RepID=UPI003F9503FB
MKCKRNTITGIVGIIAVILCFIIMQSMRQIPNLIEPGPRLMPTVGLILILVSSIMLLINGLRDKKEEKPYFPEGGVKKLVFAFALLCVYGILLTLFGFLITTPFAMFAFVNMLKEDEKVTWWQAVLISIVVTAFLYGMFVIGFQIKLPSGILFN